MGNYALTQDGDVQRVMGSREITLFFHWNTSSCVWINAMKWLDDYTYIKWTKQSYDITRECFFVIKYIFAKTKSMPGFDSLASLYVAFFIVFVIN